MDFKPLRLSLTLFITILVTGTACYHYIENMPLFEAFYMVVITISTVGFGEIRPLSPLGRAVTVVIISTGGVTAAYTLGMLMRMFIEGELKKSMGRRRLEKDIAKLKDHYIVCGYGRIGSLICQELDAENIGFVVIESDPAAVSELEDVKYLFLHMDATSDEALLEAGIMRAKGIVPAVRSDSDNVFITLTAKGLRPDIFVLSRASDTKNEKKLIRAGASRVVSPYLIGGRRMAQILKRPTVVDFIDIAMMESRLGLMIEEAKIGVDSNLIGKNLIQSNLRQNYGVIIVAIKKQGGEMIFNPQATEILHGGDIIVVIGKKDDLKRMNDVL